MSGDVTRIKRECREWLALLQSGEANEADRARFTAWLRADPRHQRAYDGLRMLWRDISTLSQLKELEPVPRPASKTTRRFLPLAAAAAAAGLAIAHLLSQPPSVQQPVTTWKTAYNTITTHRAIGPTPTGPGANTMMAGTQSQNIGATATLVGIVMMVLLLRAVGD